MPFGSQILLFRNISTQQPVQLQIQRRQLDIRFHLFPVEIATAGGVEVVLFSHVEIASISWPTCKYSRPKRDISLTISVSTSSASIISMTFFHRAARNLSRCTHRPPETGCFQTHWFGRTVPTAGAVSIWGTNRRVRRLNAVPGVQSGRLNGTSGSISMTSRPCPRKAQHTWVLLLKIPICFDPL